MSHQYDPPEPLHVEQPQFDYRSKPKPKRGWLWLLIPAALLVLGFIVVGGYFGYHAYRSHQDQANADAAIKACQEELGDYVDTLASIDARLDVGLNQDELGNDAADASVERNQVDEDAVQGISDMCQRALKNANKAMDLYAETSSDWNDCIVDYYCSTDDEELGWQLKWALASIYISDAQDLMKGKEPPKDSKGSDDA